jgi:hypothetical protein
MDSEIVAPKLRSAIKLPGRRAGLAFGALLVASMALPSAGLTATDSASVAGSSTVDISDAIAPDGTFNGRPGLAGTIDVGGWSLISDIGTGEAPRFEQAGEGATVAQSGVPTWMALGSNAAGTNGAINTTVYALAIMGSDLYVGGGFTNVAGIATADFLARWDGNGWSAVGPVPGWTEGALSGAVTTMAVEGSVLYVGGLFHNAAGIATADRLASWNGSSWSAFGSDGAGDGALKNQVYAVAAGGGNVYVGGLFTDAGADPTADYVARWNGISWTGLGSNGAGNGALANGNVLAIAVYGADVYVGGGFTNAGGVATADFVARWNGSTWSGLGSNGAGNGALTGIVYTVIRVGTDVYVGGNFQNTAGIQQADYVARFDGSNWAALGSDGAGTNGALGSWVLSLSASGGDIYAAGFFTDAGAPAADFVAVWNGSAWSGLGSNGAGNGAIVGGLNAVRVNADGAYVGGVFNDAAGLTKADCVAQYGVPPVSPKPDGRIRKGTGAYVGNNIYNADGTGQSKSGAKPRGSTITFGITIQNDGTGADRFSVQATGSATTMYRVRYFRGTTEITTAVVAGTYQTPLLAVGAKYLITTKVKVKSTATSGSSVTRLVTIRSVADTTKLDAVKFIGKRG